MAGHSKWSNIKFRKKAQDNKRCKIFNKLSNEITQIATLSNSPESDSKLKMIINKALSLNMPKKNIEKAIERGQLNSKLEEKIIGGFCNSGIAILLCYEKKNNDKIENEIKNLFEKNKYSLTKYNNFAHIFKKEYIFKIKKVDYDEAVKLLKNFSTRKIKNIGEYVLISVDYEKINHIISTLNSKKIEIINKTLRFEPVNKIKVCFKEESTFKLFLKKIKNISGIKHVFFNI